MLVCVTEQTLSRNTAHLRVLRGGHVIPDAGNAEFGEEWTQRMCFLKNEHFKNEEENKSILDLLIALEIVRVG